MFKENENGQMYIAEVFEDLTLGLEKFIGRKLRADEIVPAIREAKFIHHLNSYFVYCDVFAFLEDGYIDLCSFELCVMLDPENYSYKIDWTFASDVNFKAFAYLCSVNEELDDYYKGYARNLFEKHFTA